MFKLDGAIVKINVDTGALIRKPLPDGLFPTEPIFVQRPGSSKEDDGVIIVSGIDGGRQKGFVVIYNATDMEVLFHATAPKKTLFGVHSKFFTFTEGCSEADRDCTPPTVSTTTATTATTTSPVTTEPEACPSGWVDALIYGCFAFLEETDLTMMEAMLACEEVGKMKVNESSQLCIRLVVILPSQKLPSR